MSVCIIPARGGSKRVPRKNIRQFSGRPMITWSIAAAKESGCFSRIVVSTDDSEIADVALKAGAEVPFLRRRELADDHTHTAPVVADAVAQLGLDADQEVCCLYATAPFVCSSDLLAGRAMLRSKTARFVAAVTTFPFPIQRALRRAEDGRVAMFDPDQMTARSQDLEEAWHDAGQFYWGLASTWQDPEASVFGPGAYGLPLPRHRVQDIDTEEDWLRAEYLMATLQVHGVRI